MVVVDHEVKEVSVSMGLLLQVEAFVTAHGKLLLLVGPAL